MGPSPRGEGRRAAVLGSPIAHSLSPALHRAAYAALGLDWTYDAVDVDEAGLPAFVDSLDASWVGLSLTMPLKQAVLPLLTSVSPLAALVGAANTVVFGDDGSRTGENTDVPGMVTALRSVGVVPAPPVATVIGGGATARSAVAALAELGVGRVEAYLRRPSAGDELVELGDRLRLPVVVLSLAAIGPSALEVPIVVSTVPGGAADDLAGLVPPVRPGVLLDVAYSPWPTGLAAAWLEAGGPVASGHDLLLWQAVDQVRLMTGLEPPVEAMRAALPPR